MSRTKTNRAFCKQAEGSPPARLFISNRKPHKVVLNSTIVAHDLAAIRAAATSVAHALCELRELRNFSGHVWEFDALSDSSILRGE